MDKEFKFSATEFAHMMRISPSALRKRRLTGKLDGQFKKVDNNYFYKYHAKGVEKYENGVFSGFNSKTNQNKKEKYVNITIDPTDKGLIIDGSSFKGKVNKDLIIGTWWNHEIVQKKAQISAVSGRIIEQKVEFKGKEDVKIGDKVYKTLRFNFSSSDPSLSKDKKLNTDIWYEEETFLWVKAAFDKTGYWEYRLKKVK